MPESLRAFIAVPVPETERRYFRQIQTTLASEVMDVRWVRPEQIHLTLKFLGDIDPSQVPAIASQLDLQIRSLAAFPLQIKGGGGFPDIRQARVLWMGLDDATSALQPLHAAVEIAAAAVGLPRDTRLFRPHLTLGRPRRSVDPVVQDRLLTLLQAVTSAVFTVDRICLYQSRLYPSGARYTVLHTAMLASGINRD